MVKKNVFLAAICMLVVPDTEVCDTSVKSLLRDLTDDLKWTKMVASIFRFFLSSGFCTGNLDINRFSLMNNFLLIGDPLTMSRLIVEQLKIILHLIHISESSNQVHLHACTLDTHHLRVEIQINGKFGVGASPSKPHTNAMMVFFAFGIILYFYKGYLGTREYLATLHLNQVQMHLFIFIKIIIISFMWHLTMTIDI